MKWLFLLLLLVNIGLFIWTYPQYQEQQQKPPALPESVERLMLLSEAHSPKESQDQPDADSAEQASSLELEEVKLGDEAVVPAVAQNNAATSAEVEADPASSVQAQDPAPVVGQDAPPVQSETVSVKEIAQQKLSCEKIGPVSKRADADQLSARLAALGLQSDISSESRRDSDGFWVMVPPQANRSKAVEIVNRLKKAGIKDLWRFTSGTLAHAISLGLFRDEGRAEARRSLIAEKGFDVEVRPRFRQLTDYWLSYNYKGDFPITEADMVELTEAYPGLERLVILCPEIARP